MQEYSLSLRTFLHREGVQMHSTERSGLRRGIAIGEKRAEERTKRIFKLDAQEKSTEEIAELCGITVQKVLDILA